jgi:hypothetical protein
MSGKHKGWTRLPSGRFRHISGAEFVVEGDGFIDIDAALKRSTSTSCTSSPGVSLPTIWPSAHALSQRGRGVAENQSLIDKAAFAHQRRALMPTLVGMWRSPNADRLRMFRVI